MSEDTLQRCWIISIDTPSGVRVVGMQGPATEAEALAELGRHLTANPEWTVIPGSVEFVHPLHAEARVAQIRREMALRYPYRPTLEEMTSGEPIRILQQPWLDPESMQVRDPMRDLYYARELGMVR